MTVSELSTTTCSANCWHAKEDACRCMCAGANHGVLLKEGAKQPARTRRIKGRMFELTGIHQSWMAANKDRTETSKAFNAEHNLQWFKENAVMQSATESQRKWAEVQNFIAGTDEEMPNAYLIWRKIW